MSLTLRRRNSIIWGWTTPWCHCGGSELRWVHAFSPRLNAMASEARMVNHTCLDLDSSKTQVLRTSTQAPRAPLVLAERYGRKAGDLK